jgi:putative ABC transport system substrate-binding protein
MIRRRDFITLLGGVGAAWSMAARAQQATMPLIGYLDPGTQEAAASFVAAFRRGLSQAGYVEGRDVAIEFRWGENDLDRLPQLATDLVRHRVSLIAASESTAATRAAKSATTTIPIVFVAGQDPVQSGLVASLNRPGGNATGIIHMNAALGPKRLGLLHELLPKAALFAVLSGNDDPAFLTDFRTAAAATNLAIEFFIARSIREIDAAFAKHCGTRSEGGARQSRPALYQPASPNRYARDASYLASDLSMARGRCSGWADELWTQHH